MDELKKKIKKFWNWLWNSENILSYIILLAIMFIIIKYLLIPGIGFIFGTSLPLAIVESSSMDHHSLRVCSNEQQNTVSLYGIQLAMSECTKYYPKNINEICGKQVNISKFYNSNNYWNTCGQWYEENTNITKEQFEKFSFKNGFRKGDIIIIFGKKDINIGDVIIFQAKYGNAIIHRVIRLNPIETKGDHNSVQLNGKNNNRVDETFIPEDKIIGTAIARIPYLGYIKIWALSLLFLMVKNMFLSILIIIILTFIFYIKRKVGKV